MHKPTIPFVSSLSVEELLEVTPKHSQGCHERLRIAALLGKPLSGLAKYRLQLGRFLHTNLAEGLILLLVTTELLLTCIEVGVETGLLCLFRASPDIIHKSYLEKMDHIFACETSEGERTALFLESVESVSRTIVAFFGIEMLLKLVVAPCEVVRNPWHFLDCSVVGLNVFFAFFWSRLGCGEHMTLLLRLWRTIKFLKLIEEEADMLEAHIRKKLANELSGHESCESHEAIVKPQGGQLDRARVHSDIGSKQCEVSSSLGQRTSPVLFTEHITQRGTQIGCGLGTLMGTTFGAGLGVLPAFFTFGITVPIFAAIGGATGLVVGSTVGAAAGFVGGWATHRLKAD